MREEMVQVAVGERRFRPIVSAWAEVDGEQFYGTDTFCGRLIGQLAMEQLLPQGFRTATLMQKHPTARTPEERGFLQSLGLE